MIPSLCFSRFCGFQLVEILSADAFFRFSGSCSRVYQRNLCLLFVSLYNGYIAVGFLLSSFFFSSACEHSLLCLICQTYLVSHIQMLRRFASVAGTAPAAPLLQLKRQSRGKSDLTSSSMKCTTNSDGERSVHATAKKDLMRAAYPGISKEEARRIIAVITSNTPYAQQKQHVRSVRDQKLLPIQLSCKAYDALLPCQKTFLRYEVQEFKKSLEAEYRGDVSRVYIHVDMDMFYAAVEEKYNPRLTHVPFAVGSTSMITTANYIARRYHVKAGMPGVVAKALCPQLQFVPVQFARYEQESAVLNKIAAKYDPNFSSMGLDEVTCDVTDYFKRQAYRNLVPDGQALLNAAEILATRIRKEVFEQTSLTSSCGVAVTGPIKKMVSDYNKPDGQYVLKTATTPTAIAQFMAPIPIRDAIGIGEATENMLKHVFNIHTCGQLVTEAERLYYSLPLRTAEILVGVGLGLSVNKFMWNRPTTESCRSISRSKTVGEIYHATQLTVLMRMLLSDCIKELTEKQLVCRTVTIFVKYKTFFSVQTSATLSSSSSSSKPKHTPLWSDAYDDLEPLLASSVAKFAPEHRLLRMIGVRLSNTTPKNALTTK